MCISKVEEKPSQRGDMIPFLERQFDMSTKKKPKPAHGTFRSSEKYYKAFSIICLYESCVPGRNTPKNLIFYFKNKYKYSCLY